jgi:alpha-beta hydrolase superfamily lysophospholipase
VYLPGADPVFGFYHETREDIGRGLAVLMSTPFGWGEAHSYRSRRSWAIQLAAVGYPTLRIDLPGTGDSGGSPRDPARLEAWTDATSVAAAWLRATSGCDRLAAFGIGLGGLVICCSIAASAPIDEVILWAVPSRGRTFLRELRAFAALQRGPTTLPDEAADGLTEDGSIAAGFVLSAETVSALETLDVTQLDFPVGRVRRALLLERDGIEVDLRLRGHLEKNGTIVTIARGEGYGVMMSARQRAQVPADILAPVEAWLRDAPTDDARVHPAQTRHSPDLGSVPASGPRAIELVVGDRSVRETPLTIDQPFGKLFGILAEPAAAQALDLSAVLLNAGPIRHTGPNRMWVEAARRWAARGVRTLRLDLEGLGDADGECDRLTVEQLYVPELLDQVRGAIDALEARGLGRRFALAGLCSGAYWSFQMALRDDRVRAAFMINPLALFWDPSLESDRGIRRGPLRRSSWRRILSREVPFRRIVVLAGKTPIVLAGIERRAQSRRQELDRALDQLRDSHKHVMFAFSEDEPLYEELKRDGRLDSMDRWPNLTLEVLSGREHILQALGSQHEAHFALDCALERELARMRRDPSGSHRDGGSRMPRSERPSDRSRASIGLDRTLERPRTARVQRRPRRIGPRDGP